MVDEVFHGSFARLSVARVKNVMKICILCQGRVEKVGVLDIHSVSRHGKKGGVSWYSETPL